MNFQQFQGSEAMPLRHLREVYEHADRGELRLDTMRVLTECHNIRKVTAVGSVFKVAQHLKVGQGHEHENHTNKSR
jgi:hypothetical protein